MSRQDLDGEVTLERFGAVAQLTLNRPAALNAMTWHMYQQLVAHLDALAQDTTVRAIVLRGAGTRAFAAGTDISQFASFTGADGLAYEEQVDRIMDRIASMPQPLLAAISGYAVGGGLVLATACDLRYATPTAKLGVPVARTLGNCLSLRNYARLAQAFGLMRAKELLFTARLMTAQEALAAGFLAEVVEEEQIFERALEVARQISQNAPLTLWATKEAYRRLAVAEDPARANVAFEDVIERIYGSADFHEGVQAHVGKRKPEWRGE